jgi:hypothetical protein
MANNDPRLRYVGPVDSSEETYAKVQQAVALMQARNYSAAEISNAIRVSTRDEWDYNNGAIVPGPSFSSLDTGSVIDQTASIPAADTPAEDRQSIVSSAPAVAQSDDIAVEPDQTLPVEISPAPSAPHASAAVQTSSTSTSNHVISAKQNPLAGVTSVSYVLSWYTIDVADYNLIQDAVDKAPFKPKPGTLLVSSAGTGLEKHPEFDVDFFLDDFDVNTLIGLSKYNRNTNVVDFTFSVTEPYGVSLVERLIRSATAGNYLQQPYILTIDFVGYDSAGVELASPPAARKVIPFKITDFSFDLTTSGSVYQISAIPYNHIGYDTLRNIVPFQVEIESSTIDEFFSTSVRTYTEIRDDRYEAIEDTYIKLGSMGQRQHAGLAGALNQHQLHKVGDSGGSKLQEYPDIYHFEFPPEISSSAFNAAAVLNLKEHEVPLAKRNIESYQTQIGKNITLSKGLKNFAFGVGTSIVEIINLMVCRSDYMLSQIKLTPGGQLDDEASDVPIYWWKVIPRVRLLEFDRIRNEFQKEITYTVVMLPVNGRNYDGIGKQMPEAPHKRYDYIFTGRNTEILDFKLQFNAAYYQARTMVKNNVASVETGPETNQMSGALVNLDSKSAMPKRVEYVPNPANITNNSESDLRTIVAGDITDSLLNTTIDMVEIKLNIYGDPDYINTTDYWLPVSDYNKEYVYLKDGSINYNKRETYIEVSIKTPTDINQTTGDYNSSASYNSILINGLYSVLSIKSTFSGGQFLQEIHALKLPAVDNNAIVSDKKDNEQQERQENQKLSDIPIVAATQNELIGDVLNRSSSPQRVSESVVVNSASSAADSGDEF